MNYTLKGNIVDIVDQRIFKGIIQVQDGKIENVIEDKTVLESQFILPGLVDAHIHIESSMLTPVEFAKAAVVNGTVACVSDPHEIANVLGIDGVKFMIENGKKSPFKFYFGAPSCVPATGFESSGAVLGIKETEALLNMEEIHYLSEMMNFPGVLFHDEEVMAKLKLAKKYNKPVDGHAPGVVGEDAKKYIEAGITTDHECFSKQEAVEKINYGMKILIREGSAAKNFDALIDLLDNYPDQIMFCSDDKHPDDLIKGHINELVKRAISLGIDPIKILRACILNPKQHYNLDIGLLQQNNPADMIIVDNLRDFNVLSTYIDGELVAKNGKSLLVSVQEKAPNKFTADFLSIKDLNVKPLSSKIKVIEAIEGQLITNSAQYPAKIIDDNIVSNPEEDILKLVVLNRYRKSKPAIGFIKNFGIKEGAIASTVAHDSHNIIALGSDDKSIVEAINLIIESKGGISLKTPSEEYHLALPVGGIMSDQNAYKVAADYELINQKTKETGCTLNAPFMTLSFMALLVIPALKLSDKGLFDGKKFEFTTLFEDK